MQCKTDKFHEARQAPVWFHSGSAEYRLRFHMLVSRAHEVHTTHNFFSTCIEIAKDTGRNQNESQLASCEDLFLFSPVRVCSCSAKSKSKTSLYPLILSHQNHVTITQQFLELQAEMKYRVGHCG